MIVVLGSFTFVMATPPETTDQVPIPEGGVFPAMVALFTLHKLRSAPAIAIAEGAPTWITRSLCEAGHMPLGMVHLKVSESSR